MWQVGFAPEKTQAMVISRSPAASQAVSGLLGFEDRSLLFKENIKILGMAADRCLRFDPFVAVVSRPTSQRISVQRKAVISTLEAFSSCTRHIYGHVWITVP